MAVNQVTSTYNVRRRKQSALSNSSAKVIEQPRATKRPKIEKREIFTPPASPEAIDATPGTTALQTCYEDDHEDPLLIGILNFMKRTGVPAMCSREISEALQVEGKVKLTGSTPSTLVDAAIKQHHKRCSTMNRPNIIQKIADPRFPRKTLYHLATADPFGPMPSLLSPAESVRDSSPADVQVFPQSAATSETSSDDEEFLTDLMDERSNDCQGPFAASIDTRRRMSLSPSPELEFGLSIEDARKSIATPAASEPASPMKIVSTKDQFGSRLNIASPPSPFITPRAGDEDDDDDDGVSESQQEIKSPRRIRNYFKIPLIEKDSTTPYDDDLYDIEVTSPEALSLDDLETLLGY